jgi:glycine cleavage system transcriptional repressor
MEKAIISVLGQDRPGIIAAVSRILFGQDCNIENVTQTIIQNQFSGIFIVATPAGLEGADLGTLLNRELRHLQLEAFVRPLPTPAAAPPAPASEPFVITTRGPDRKGLVAAVTAVLASHQVNVTQLQAVFKGGEDPGRNVMIYEVDVPLTVDQQLLRNELRRTAAGLDLHLSIQHRHIFEALNRI